ncbi:MAG: TPM domain-containing protein [Muribaculaceae bacterium]|nr:TPM domain-containing protein [Muribaculaceae bacterium]
MTKDKIGIFFIFMLYCVCLSARDYKPEEIVNPNIANRYEYVADPGNMLGSQTRNNVNARLQALRDSTTAEVAVAIVPSIGDYSIEDFSEKVFTRWGLGKKDKDNGVLLLISPDSHEVRIQTGYGSEGVLPDIICGRIIREAVIPNMRDDCLDCAVEEATAMISRVMTNPEYADELRSSLRDNHSGIEEAPVSKETITGFLVIVAVLLWIFAAVSYISRRVKTRKISSEAIKAQEWRTILTRLGLLSLATLLTALPFYLLALYHYRRARYGNHVCAKCGGKSVRVKGHEALGALSPSQQFEEKIGSVHYDVHRCEKCGNTEVTPYPVKKSKYTYCSHCGTRAYHYIGNRTLRQPTYHAEGEGVSQYRCDYCGRNDDKGYRIPKKDMAAAMAAAAMLGSSRRRGGGGGFGGGFDGGFGGGFGGGRTGGGGASGRW